jgi:5'-nucleotidase / UDP-sugar diphosphatase
MKTIYNLIFAAFILLFSACASNKKAVVATAINPNDFVEAYIVQMNDVYEIGTLEGGKRGGLARVATVVNNLRAKNPNTYLIMAGDFLNPSFLGTLKYEDKTIKGRHMVDVMNTMKTDYVVFGNHEFDLDYADLQARIDESTFNWISSDCYDMTSGNPLKFHKNVNGKPEYFEFFTKINIPNGEENPFTIGLFSATIPFVKKDYIHYKSFYEEASKCSYLLSQFTDVNVGITHLEIMQDTTLAQLVAVNGTPLLMGGHDHENMKVKIGKTTITKADANAKSVYIHRFLMEKSTRKVTIDSKLMLIDDSIKEDSTVNFVVDKWKKIGEESMKKQGFDPNAVVGTLKGKLNARESSMRNEQNGMGDLITQSMLFAAKKAKIALFNSGSVRIDDFVSGNITETDVLRIMPYGGALVEVEIKGSLLLQILESGDNNKGKGGYLQRSSNLSKVGSQWFWDKKALDSNANYTVITSKFLFEGKEKNIEYFTKANENVLKSDFPDPNNINDKRNDVRKAFIAYLRSMK